MFVKLDSRYADYFPEYSKYFERVLILLKSMYDMNNYGKLFYDELTEWLLEAGSIQYQFQMSIYYNYALDGTNIVVLYYVDDFVYWYTSEAPGRFFVDTLRKIFHVKFLGYAHWLMSIRISHMNNSSFSVYQAIYDNHIVAKNVDTATVKASTKLYKTTLPSDMMFTKAYVINRGEQVEKLTR